MVHSKSEELVLHRVLRRHAQQTPGKPLFKSHERDCSYGEAAVLTNRIADALRGMRVGKGDTVLVMLPGSIDYVLIWLALSRIGAILVPVNDAYKGNVLLHQVNDSEARSMIIDARYLDRVELLAPQLLHLKHLALRGGDPQHVAGARGRWAVFPYKALFEGDASEIDAGVEYHEPSAIFYTSGTTGPSKGVLYGHAQGHATALPMARQFSADDTFYMFNPLYHVGLAHIFGAVLLSHGTLVLRERFSAEAFWPDVRRFGATATLMLGAVANFIYRRPTRPDDRKHPLRRVLMVPLLKEVDEFRRRFNCEVMTWFNMTEVSTPLHSDGFTLVNNKSCGQPREGIQARVVNEWDEPVADGEIGELVLRPARPWEFNLGYWKNPAATVQAWRNLWFHTGDMFVRDAEGNFYFVDRLKDAIRRRGENISSYEVEEEVNSHPSVLESAAVAVPSEFGEDEVKVVAALRPDQELTPEALLRYLEPRMPYFMLPRYVKIVRDELQKTPTGKIQKHGLRLAGTAGCWDREAARYKVKR
jgi:crotonobetaine/carnitine-CoA ligase